MANNQSGDSKRSGGPEHGGKGNFSNDPQRAADAGKKGGQQSQSTTHKDISQKDSAGSQRGGSGSFANDPQKASEAGRKGGEHSHGGSK